ncbi:MAG: hypothetical protein EXS24_00715 [Pedosphaera sp.]|nr:hypothetical protein [Pedosphaera sp.]
MKRVFYSMLFIAATLVALEPAKLAGKYEGQVDGKSIRIELLADGSLSLQPNVDDATVVVKGTWKADDNGIKLRVADPDGGNHDVHFRLQGADLILLKHVKPGGEAKTFVPPQFKADKPAKDGVGVFRGELEGKKIELDLMAEGKCKVSVDDGDKEERRPGTWSVKDGILLVEIKAKEGAAKIRLQQLDGGLSLIDLVLPDGNQKFFQVRFGKRP